jgi:ABC-type polysaccharide/polyol phosphate export permease
LVNMPGLHRPAAQFSSSVFVWAESMPGWLEEFVNVNLITAIVDAIRAPMLGGPSPSRSSGR